MNIDGDSGRSTCKNRKTGICGEHGVDPESVHFCDEIGLDDMSCSPRRTPITSPAAVKTGKLRTTHDVNVYEL
ncbi:MAG: putative PEP-binding protein [Planctomycetales bacterium]